MYFVITSLSNVVAIRDQVLEEEAGGDSIARETIQPRKAV